MDNRVYYEKRDALESAVRFLGRAVMYFKNALSNATGDEADNLRYLMELRKEDLADAVEKLENYKKMFPR